LESIETALGKRVERLPLLVVDGPGLDSPWTSNFYTSEQVLEALAKARG